MRILVLVSCPASLSYLNCFVGNPANGTASRDSGLGLEGEYGGFQGFPGALLAGMMPGLGAMPGGFPGFPFGFPAAGFTGGETLGQSPAGGTRASFNVRDTDFMAGGNIDFIKMAARVRLGWSKGFQSFISSLSM